MHVVLSLAPGGAERLVVDLCRQLNAEMPSCVCCLDEAGVWASDLEQAGIPVTVMGRQSGFHPALGLRIAALARHHRVRVLHCHQYSPFVYGSIAALRRPGLRLVFTEHGRLADASPSAKRRWANSLLGHVPDRIVAVSHELRGYMLAEGFPADRVEVIHNGIDPGPGPAAEHRARARVDLGLAPGAFVVGTVARFDPVKRLDLLVDAFDTVVRSIPNARLVMVGGGPERARLEDLIRDRGLLTVVTMPGPRLDARELMPAFDVYANTSESEGVSLTVLEALAASIPVVATRVGGTPEVLTGNAGVLVRSGDGRAVADAIAGLARDPGARRAMGAAGRARVIEHFSLRQMAAQYLAAYRGRTVDRE